MDAPRKHCQRLSLAEVEALLYQDEGGTGWLCPAHDDTCPSLSVNQGDKGIVIKCHAGYTLDEVCAALGIEPWQLFAATREERTDDSNSKGNGSSLAFDGCTLAEYATAKGLDLEMLKECGLFEKKTPNRYDGKPVVF